MRNQSRARSTPGIFGRLIGERQEIGRREPILRVKYGFHSLRHLFASWLLESFSLKKARAMLGYATMAMTAGTYGHLLPNLENDAAKKEAGALAPPILASVSTDCVSLGRVLSG